jgi:hypothetical protein
MWANDLPLSKLCGGVSEDKVRADSLEDHAQVQM